MRVVFAGTIGRAGVGGLAWMNMQYLAGLRALGHDVYYLEDCGEGSWVYNWDTEQLTTDLAYPAAYVREALEPLGLGERWIYRTDDNSAGMTVEQTRAICAEADLLIVQAVPLARWREEYLWPRRRAFIDVDPGFIQISLIAGAPELSETVDRCERLFTIAQRMGKPDCLIPTAGREWVKTLPPVCLEQWTFAPDGAAEEFTSVMQWRGFRDVTHEGVTYGQKDREFPGYIDLPRHTRQPLRLALTGAPPEDLERHGWRVTPGWVPSRTPWTYREFIRSSRAEFGVAKHGYVAMRGGWFSDRTVCYLASGRPALLQDTGLRDWLPVGEGVVTFTNPEEAIRGIEIINENYPHHREAARRIAERYFATESVLPPLIEAAMA